MYVGIKFHVINWDTTWQNQQSDCAPSEDSDQPGHPPSLIKVFSVRMKKTWILSYPLNTQRRLWSDWADAQADLSLRWAHTHFVGFVMSQLSCSCKLSDTANFRCWFPLAGRDYSQIPQLKMTQTGRILKILILFPKQLQCPIGIYITLIVLLMFLTTCKTTTDGIFFSNIFYF